MTKKVVSRSLVKPANWMPKSNAKIARQVGAFLALVVGCSAIHLKTAKAISLIRESNDFSSYSWAEINDPPNEEDAGAPVIGNFAVSWQDKSLSLQPYVSVRALWGSATGESNPLAIMPKFTVTDYKL